MRIIVNGQQGFGKACLEAMLDRGDDVVAVYCAPDKEGKPVVSSTTRAKAPRQSAGPARSLSII